MQALQDPVLPIAEESQSKILLKSRMPKGQKAQLAKKKDARGRNLPPQPKRRSRAVGSETS
jgi:hypothetical protein